MVDAISFETLLPPLLGTGDPKLESDFVFLVDDVGAYLVDELGHLLIES